MTVWLCTDSLLCTPIALLLPCRLITWPTNCESQGQKTKSWIQAKRTAVRIGRTLRLSTCRRIPQTSVATLAEARDIVHSWMAIYRVLVNLQFSGVNRCGGCHDVMLLECRSHLKAHDLNLMLALHWLSNVYMYQNLLRLRSPCFKLPLCPPSGAAVHPSVSLCSLARPREAVLSRARLEDAG